jgi:hypothetical protein
LESFSVSNPLPLESISRDRTWVSKRQGFGIYRLPHSIFLTLKNLFKVFWVCTSFVKCKPQNAIVLMNEAILIRCWLQDWVLVVSPQMGAIFIIFLHWGKRLHSLNCAFLSPAKIFRNYSYSILSNQWDLKHLLISRRK